MRELFIEIEKKLYNRTEMVLVTIGGGNVTLFFSFIKGNDAHMLNLCRIALEQFSEKKTTWLVTELTDSLDEQALRISASYIGVIASASKRIIVEKNLVEHDFIREDLNRVTAPIGLMGVKAKTPAEIALSIAGQLIVFRAGAGIVR